MTCDTVIEGDGADDKICGCPDEGAAGATLLITGLFAVTSDLHTVDDSVELCVVAVAAVVAFDGTVFSTLHNVAFNCNGWLDDATNGALLLFFTTNFCMFFFLVEILG